MSSIIIKLIIISLSLLLFACDKVVVVERTSVSVDTNAYYTAFQKNPDEEWNEINFNNDAYLPETYTLTIEELNDPYAVVFVCPSDKSHLPHQVFVYYATPQEMRLIDFTCRIAPEEIKYRPVYGKINGVERATLNNPQGELVHLALSNSVSLNILGAYAAEVAKGRRDIVAFKGKHALNDIEVESPESFLIFRRVTDGANLNALRADAGFTSTDAGYAAPFNLDARSTVVVNGLNAGEVADSEVRFVSTNKSVLHLVKSKENNFSFLPVPLKASTKELGDTFSNPDEFDKHEGHEINVKVMDNSGNIDRQVTKFFTLSNAQQHVVNFPDPLDTMPNLSSQTSGKYQIISATWNEYNDELDGEAKLYRWIFEGQAADPAVDTTSNSSVVANRIDNVRWVVNISPAWLKLTNRTPGVFSFSLPKNFISRVERNNSIVDVWSDDWGFKAGTAISWEFGVYSASDSGNVENIVDYLINRNIVENFSLSEVHARATTLPSS